MSRRGFLAAALATGAAVALPPALRRRIGSAAADATDATFFTTAQYDTCAAICARIVPDSTVGPAFVDRFLTGPGVFVHGPYTGRNPFPDPATGLASTTFPSDDALTGPLPLSPVQELTWKLALDGEAALDNPPSGLTISPAWRAQLGDVLPAPTSLRQTYIDGLAAFDEYSQSVFGSPFAAAPAEQQDVMLELAGNVVVSQFPFPSPPAAPDAAKALFPHITVHTFQACYGLPEYRGTSDTTGMLWDEIGWDGDTQPLGNSIYWNDAFEPGRGPNRGFGDPAGFEPRGTYREFRPVSTIGEHGDHRDATTADLATLIDALKARQAAPLQGAPLKDAPMKGTQ
jgi:hypothetical protein